MTATVEEREASDAQHARGRLLARERLDILFDKGSLVEAGPAGDGVVTAHGTVRGRPIMAFSQDVTDGGGIVTAAHAEKIGRLLDEAVAARTPIVGLYGSPGAALDNGLTGLEAQVTLMRQQADARGKIPQVALVFGETAGAAALAPALADVIFMLQADAALMLAGSEVLRAATGELASTPMLGGATLHATQTGIADGVFADEIELLFATRALLDLLPGHRNAPRVPSDADDRAAPALDTLVPLDPAEPYDMRELARTIVDERDLVALQPDHARNLICVLGRIDGHAVGILANQPLELGGAMDSAATRKAIRFVQRCTRLRLPLITLVDTPGFLPTSAEAGQGIVRDAALLLGALADLPTPRVTIVTRRAFGPAWAVLAPSSDSRATCYAWPSAQIAAMGGGAAAERLFDAGEDQKKRDYAARIADPTHAIAAGFVRAVIRPATTRQVIAAALRHATPGSEFGSTLPNTFSNRSGT